MNKMDRMKNPGIFGTTNHGKNRNPRNQSDDVEDRKC
jgi:hypothetical protein